MHHDELWYLFYVPLATPMFSPADPENNTVERLTRIWQEFALKGYEFFSKLMKKIKILDFNFRDPNSQADQYLKNIHWPTYDLSKKQYLEIGNDLKIKSNGIYPERMELWDRLFPVEDMLMK